MASTSGAGKRERAPAPAIRLRTLFLGILGCWFLFPFLQIGVLAEDAIPFVAAARVDASVPNSLYGSDSAHETTEQIRSADCTLTPPDLDCRPYAFPFLGPPQIVPVMEVVNLFGDHGSLFLFRLVGVGVLAGGFVVLWNRVAANERTEREAQRALLLAVVLVTPFVYVTTAFGQSAPLMVLSACLGLSGTGRRRGAIGAAVTFGAAVLFKVFPIPLLLLAAVRRRWQFIWWTLGLLAVLTVISLVALPTFQYSEFLRSSRELTASRVASPFNVSIDSVIHLFDESWLGQGTAFLGLVFARLLVLLALFWWKLRDADEDRQWSYAWVALLALHPQIWWHYFIVIVPAVVYAVRGRKGPVWWLVPASAAALLPLIVLDGSAIKYYSAVITIVAAVGLPFLNQPRVHADVVAQDATG